MAPNAVGPKFSYAARSISKEPLAASRSISFVSI
jgi:hypothetical protein